MGRKRHGKRKKSSESDCDVNVNGNLCKQTRRHGHGATAVSEHLSLCELVSETSSVLYHSETVCDVTTCDTCDNTQEPVFDPSVSSVHPRASSITDQGKVTPLCEPHTDNLNMASNVPDRDSDSYKLDQVLLAVCDIKKSQDALRKALESKIDKLRTDLIANIDTKVRALRDELSMDVNRESSRIDTLLTSVQDLHSRMNNVEHSRATDGPNIAAGQSRDPLNDPDLTVTVNGLPFRKAKIF